MTAQVDYRLDASWAQIEDKQKSASTLQTLPARIFNPDRLLILSILYWHGEAEFKELKFDIQTTDGNLASHLRALEVLKLINYEKELIGRKYRTSYRITNRGRKTLEEFIEVIQRTVANVPGEK